MGVIIPQVVTEDRASGALVIDGSLRFDGSSNYLSRTPGSAGNRRTWTWSGWLKRASISFSTFFAAGDGTGSNRNAIDFDSDNVRLIVGDGAQLIASSAVFRDPNAWYHFVFVMDTTQGTSADRMKMYVNGSQITNLSTSTYPSLNYETFVNATNLHTIGARYRTSVDGHYSGYLSNINFIDGQALGPENFGYTDPLTNTWRPKKYTGTYGTNGFWLPLDGNTPIGQDQSGRGNNWTPVNFAGSNTIEKATGALPILNTDGGGKVARVGVRTDAYASNLVLALPLVGSSADVSNQINSGSTTKTVTGTGSPTPTTTQSNFYGGSFDFSGNPTDGALVATHYLTIGSSADFNFGTGDFTIEMWLYSSTWNGGGTNDDVVPFSHVAQNALLYITYSGSSVGRFAWYDGSAVRQSGYELPAGRWVHVAISRSSGITRLFADGIERHAFADSVNYGTSSIVLGKGTGNNLNAFYGQMSDLRIYKGVAKYTSNFIPASTDPDILPDTPSGVASSSALTKVTDGAVKFDGTNDYLAVANSNDFDFDGIFTMETFVYADTLAANPVIFSRGGGSTGSSWSTTNGAQFALYVTTTGVVRFEYNNGANGSHTLASSAGSVVAKRWHHIAVTYDTTTFTLWVDGVSAATGTGSPTMPTTRNLVYVGMWPTSANIQEWQGFISNLRFVKGTQLYTSNFTPPTRALTNVTNTKLLCCQSNTSASAAVVAPTVSASDAELNISFTNTSFPDISGNSILVSNGNSVTRVTAPSNSYGLTYAAEFTATSEQRLVTGDVGQAFNNPFSFDGFFYLKNIGGTGYLFDGRSATYTSSFYVYYTTDSGTGTATFYTAQGSFVKPVGQWFHLRCTSTGVWYNGEYQANASGYGEARFDAIYLGSRYTFSTYLDGYVGAFRFFRYEDIGAPSPEQYTLTSGVPSNSLTVLAVNPFGNASATTLNPFTTDINTVRGQESGYCTYNPLNITSSVTLKNGNLQVDHAGTPQMQCTVGNVFASTGKWYAEITKLEGGVEDAYGIVTDAYRQDNLFYSAEKIGAYRGGNVTTSGFGSVVFPSFNAAGQVLGLYMDLDNQKFGISVDGSAIVYVNIGDYDSHTPGERWTWMSQSGSSGGQGSYRHTANFGQKPFKFPPPDGFQPLNAANARPSNVILNPDKYFGVVTFTGSSSGGTYTLPISNPDLVWSKNRADGATNHTIQDSVRGFGDGQNIYSNLTNGPSGTGNILSINGTTATYGTNSNFTGNCVTWCWKAGGNSNTFNVDGVGYASAAAAGLDGGSGITLTGASVGTKQGFSILRYTGGASGSTLSHGLTQAPDFWIIKNLSGSTQGTAGPHWYTKHKNISGGKTGNNSLFLNLTNGESNGPHGICRTSGDSLFEFVDGSSNDVNWHTHDSAATYICYAWHDVPGLQKFGTYEGNDSADNAFVDCGFKPAMIIIRNIDALDQWHIADTTRKTVNPINMVLRVNIPNAEVPQINGSAFDIDFLSNGFKIRGANSEIGDPATYIYMAWAEAPTFNLYGAQSNAR